MLHPPSAPPLRAIVRLVTGADGVLYEVLECGHWVPPKLSSFGLVAAARRRCRRCATAHGRATSA